MGIIKATLINPRSLAVWPDGVQIGEVAEPICLISPTDRTTEQDEANARLIAAAPELLEAAKNLRDRAVLDAEKYAPEGNEPIWAFISEITDAITRATTDPYNNQTAEQEERIMADSEARLKYDRF